MPGRPRITGTVEVLKPIDEWSNRHVVLVDGVRVGIVERVPSGSGRPRAWQPCTAAGIRLGKLRRTRQQAVIEVLLAHEGSANPVRRGRHRRTMDQCAPRVSDGGR